MAFLFFRKKMYKLALYKTTTFMSNRKQLLPLLTIGLITLFAWGCKKETKQVLTDSFINGKVIDYVTKQPIEGINVNLFSDIGFWNGTTLLTSAKTAKDGSYHLAYHSTQFSSASKYALVYINSLNVASELDSNYSMRYLYFQLEDALKKTIVDVNFDLQEYSYATIYFVHDIQPINSNDSFDCEIFNITTGQPLFSYKKLTEKTILPTILKCTAGNNKILITVTDYKPGIQPIKTVDSTYFKFKQTNTYTIKY